MLRVALAAAFVLAVGGQLDGLVPRAERARAEPASPHALPAWPPEAPVLAWPDDGRIDCPGACALRVPTATEGELWVTWDGVQVRRALASLDGEAGVPALDALRLGAVQGEEEVRIWARGLVGLVVVPEVEGRPNLVALVPAHLGAAAAGALSSGCLAEERGTRCVRLSTGVANNGDAPLRLASGHGGGPMLQGLPDGKHVAGNASYHAAHGHFHYARFMAFDLHAVGPEGLRGKSVVSTSKTGFCMVDWGAVADAEAVPAKTFWRDGCEAHQRRLEMGVNPGWYDVYRWFLPEQVLDVAGIPDGTYELVVTVDPDGTLVERHTLDNRASVVLRLEDGVATVLEERGLYHLRMAAA